MAWAVLVIACLLAVGFVGTRIASSLRIPHSVLLVFLGVVSGLTLRGQSPDAAALTGYLSRVFPDLVLYVLLPPLVFDSAYHLDLKGLWRDLVPLTALSVVALGLSTLLIGISLHLIFGLDRLAALTFGALISATDPVAVVALFKETGAPKRLGTLIEGESLLNDGTAIVLFRLLLAGALAGAATFSPAAAIGQFCLIAGGGVAAGLAVGFLMSLLLRVTAHAGSSQLGITVAAAYLSFILADHFCGVSGVIATMTVGLYLGSRARLELNKEALEGMNHVWEFLALVANTLVFFAVGLSVDPTLLLASFRYIPLTLLIVYGARAVSIAGTIPAVNRLRLAEPIDLRYQLVLFWGGLRGGLALGLVLLLPASFPHRELFVALAIAVVFSTLIFNAVTTRTVLGLMRLTDLEPQERDLCHLTLSRVREGVLEPLLRASETGAISRDLLTRWQTVRALAPADPAEPAETPRQVVEDRYEVSSLLLSERRDYEQKLADGILGKAAFRELITRNAESIDRLGEGVGDPARSPSPRTSSPLRRRLLAATTKTVVQTLAVELEVLLQRQFTLQGLSPRTKSGRETVDRWMQRQREELQAFYRAYAYYSPVLQTLFVANRIRTQSIRALQRLAEIAEINRAVFTKAVDEVEGEYGEITAEVWQFLRPTPAYLIGRHPLFREMSRVILRKVCESAQRRQFSAGDTLLRAGQPADTLYIVVAGMLEAVPAGPAGERRRLFPGDALGESCALRRQPAAITLVALMTTEVLEVKQAQLDFILQEYPMLRAQLTDRASRIESARIPL